MREAPFFREESVTDAYIIGSVTKGTARKESDIDIMIVNPKFEAYLEDLRPYEELENIKKVVNKLKDMGVQFKLIKKERVIIYEFWYQLYNGELFHIIPWRYFIDNLPYIKITRDLCE